MKRQHLSVEQAIKMYNLPDFGFCTEDLAILHNFMTTQAKVRIYQKYEELGTIDQNQPQYLYIVLQGLVHSYYLCLRDDRFWGQHVWYRSDCVYLATPDKNTKTEKYHIQALEDMTIVLALPWRAIPTLVKQIPQMKKVIKKLHRNLRKEEQHYHYRNSLAAKHRVQLFLELHPALPHRASQEVCALHNQLSRHWYSKILTELKTSS